MTDEQTSREKLETAITQKLDSIHEDLENSELAEDSYVGGVTLHSDVIAKMVLDAIKEAGGVVGLPVVLDDLRFGQRALIGAYRRADGLDTKLLVDDEIKGPKPIYIDILSDNT